METESGRWAGITDTEGASVPVSAMPGSASQMTMSAVTAQPLPFRRLEREKHIEMLFRAFRGRRRPRLDPQDLLGPQPQQGSPAMGLDDYSQSLDHGNLGENGHMGAAEVGGPGMQQRGEHWPGASSEAQNLSLFNSVSQLHITAKPELQGPQCVPRRTYSITSGGSREQVFVAVEESSCVCLQCCGPSRSCSLKGFDLQARPVFHFERPFRVDACCLGCCLMEMKAYTPQHQLIGTVKQRWSMFTPLLEVCDSEGRSSLRIQGDCCPSRCCTNQEFQVISTIGENIGTIWKKWPGFNEEHNMDHEYFGMQVPQDMTSNTKLLLLASTFLLNHMFFEMS